MDIDENSLLAQAQRLARREKTAADEERNRVFKHRVEQVAAFVAKHSPGCSQALARALGRSPEEPLFSERAWELSKVGEEEIDFDDDNALMVDCNFLPQLITNLEGYAVSVHHFYDSDRYTFALAGGGHSSFGFSDLVGFGRLTLQYPNTFTWSNVELSQYAADNALSEAPQGPDADKLSMEW